MLPMSFNPTASNPIDLAQPIANFDRLGLPIKRPPSAHPATMEQVAFQTLQLKCLLESAFQLEGFYQATASRHSADTVVIEYMPTEGLYRSFQNQPLELKVQLVLAPVRALICVA